jgi:hypothetical protein
VDSQSVDIGHSGGMTSGAALEQSLYQIEGVEVSFEILNMIQLWLERLSFPPAVDSQSIDIGHGCISALSAALEQVISLD